ncbi:Conserved_hypothetical protein [Hexamita inflata]|uniref:Uncharacterized protein n=1 Tax=Hexamita inflata TaxID=28002 RepID=A0AA86P9T8_9EUKA|nr:Conserved hypothetical protein [Hexamita inflata]
MEKIPFEDEVILEAAFIKLVNICYGTDFAELKEALAHYKNNPVIPKSPSTNNNSNQLRNQDRLQEAPINDSFHIVEGKRKDAYEWTMEMNTIFIVVCMFLGIKSCRPKQVLELMGDINGITKSVIGSHLQKVRKQIMKQYGIWNTKEIENWMVPQDVHDERLTAIVQKWKETGFTGFSNKDMRKYLM